MEEKQTSAHYPPTPTCGVAEATDLRDLAPDDSLFYDRFIELISAEFHLPSDGQHDIKPITNLEGGDGLSVTNEELQRRLHRAMEELREIQQSRHRIHRRMEELRGNRGGGGGSKSEEKRDQQKKRTRDNEAEEKSSNVRKSAGEIEKEVTEATKGIEFGGVKVGGEEESGWKKKRKLSKEKELERAERKEHTFEVTFIPAPGSKVHLPLTRRKGKLWQRTISGRRRLAASRAAGVKVHDDQKLLKQSTRKEKRRREKLVEKWKGMVESWRKMKEEKQKKRVDNIAGRTHEKKISKIARR